MIKLLQRVLLILPLAAWCARAAADGPGEFIAVNWRNEDGLPHSIINSIVQTQDGYLWIGTYVGLVRFDGIRFVHYTPSDIPELGDERIVSLFEDRGGTLWIAVEGGRLVAWHDGRARIHLPGGNKQLQTIAAMTQDANGTIWFHTAAGEFGRLTADSAEVLARTGEQLSRTARAIIRDGEDRLWVGTTEGPKLWQDGSLVSPSGLPAALRGVVDTAAPARDGAIWAFRDRQLWRFGMSIDPVRVAGPDGVANAVNVLEDSSGRIWLSTVSGALFCRPAQGKWLEVSRQSLPGANRVLYEDREGNLWRGSFGGGLARIRPRLFTMHELAEPSNDRYARSASADSAGNVWAVVNSESLVRIPAGERVPQLWSKPTESSALRTVYVDRRDRLWVGIYGGALLYELRQGGFEPAIRPEAEAEAVSALFEDSESNLWVGFTAGSNVGMLPKGDSTGYRTVGGLPHPDVRCIAQTEDGAIWFGTHYGGVCRLQDGRWTQFTQADGLPSDYVRCLHRDSDGTLWLGTLRGLCRWKDGRFTSITSTDGLWNDSLSYLAEDERGNFWMSSFGGVFRVSRQMLNDFADGKRDSIQCVGYGRHDGLTSLECPGACQPAGAMSVEGRLWIPTVTGLASVSTRNVPENKVLPPIWIEEFSIDGKATVLSHETKSIQVPPGKRRFDFRFAALSLSAPEKVQFRHRLEGLDQDWSEPAFQRTVTYSYIPPGDYTFQVVACNNDGLWNEGGAAVQLVVLPFFWQTWWFKAGTGGLVALALVFGVMKVERWNAQLQLERLEQKHAIEHERNRIAKDIHDDLGANLTRIVFLSQRAEGASHDRDEVEHWLRMIPATARQTIQSLDEIVWAINPKHDSLESLANYVSQFAQEHLTLGGIRCVLEVPTVLPHLELGAEIRHNLVLSVREALQNIVAHARATEASVTLQLDENDLKITVKDDGAGFSTEQQEGTGNGLQNMRRRLEEMRGRFEVRSRPGHGTLIQMTLPRSTLSGRKATRDEPPA